MAHSAGLKSYRWVFYALLAMLCASIYTLLIKVSGSRFAPMEFLCGVLVFQVLFLAVTALVQGKTYAQAIFFKQPLSNIALCFICGLFGAMGNLGEVYAIETAPNVGYVSAIKLGQILIVTLLGDWVSRNASTRSTDLFWSLGVVIGILLVTVGGLDNELNQGQWLYYSFGAMLAFSIMTLLTKFISRTMEAYALTFWIISCAAFCLIIYAFEDFRALFQAENITRGYALLLASGITVGLFNLMFTKSVALAPNPGFTISINALQMLFITIGSLLLFTDQTISSTAVLGGIIALISVIRIAMSK